VERAGGGRDHVLAATNFTLPDHVESAAIIAQAGATLTGNAADNRLSGSQATDRIHGGAGDDIIYGAGELDYLYGGPGADVFILLSAADSGPNYRSRDRIVDFEADDRLNLSALSSSHAAIHPDDGDFGPGALRQTQYGPNLLLEINLDYDPAPEVSLLLLDVDTLDVHQVV
jgi:Ca2+-binding RTX toxin-like protein